VTITMQTIKGRLSRFEAATAEANEAPLVILRPRESTFGPVARVIGPGRRPFAVFCPPDNQRDLEGTP
jgi:hypothetical protein